MSYTGTHVNKLGLAIANFTISSRVTGAENFQFHMILTEEQCQKEGDGNQIVLLRGNNKRNGLQQQNKYHNYQDVCCCRKCGFMYGYQCAINYGVTCKASHM